MTDRHAGYIVILEKGVRSDDAEEGVLNAIRMLRGVISVEPIPENHALQVAEERARFKLQDQLFAVLRDK